MRVRILVVISAVLMLASLAMDMLVIPSLAHGQISDKFSPVFYWHIPIAWIALFAFLGVFVASVAYLWKRKPIWDVVATTSAELGFVFTTMFLFTGAIWAKYTWGEWWDVHDARLTSSLVLWIIYVAYFLLRAYIPGKEQRERFAAVFGILGFVDVPIVILTLFVSKNMHPGAEAFTLDKPQMIIALIIGVFAFTALYFALLFFGIHLREDAAEITEIKNLEEETNE